MILMPPYSGHASDALHLHAPPSLMTPRRRQREHIYAAYCYARVALSAIFAMRAAR